MDSIVIDLYIITLWKFFYILYLQWSEGLTSIPIIFIFKYLFEF